MSGAPRRDEIILKWVDQVVNETTDSDNISIAF